MPKGQKRYSEEFVKDFLARRRLGEPNDRLCESLGIDRKTGQKWWSQHRRQEMRTGSGLPPPKTRAQINQSAIARRARDDFAYFRLVCFGHKSDPWEIDAAERIRLAVESGRREFLVLNCFPGIGKTELLKEIVCWLIARNRTIRIIWGSANDDLAVLRVNQIRQELSRSEVAEGSEDDIRIGRAVKPRFCMAELFGRFRPGAYHGVKWRNDEFTVATPGKDGRDEGPPPPGPTLLAFGRRTKQLGPRAEFIVWDDAWDEECERNPETGKAVKKWLDRTAENRLQPGGVFCVVMQRMSANDLSRHCLDKRRPVLDEQGRQAGWEPLYQHIVYPAHHEDLCDGSHPKDRPAWDPRDPKMGHCLTDPLALPPEDLYAKMQDALFEIVYQQREVDSVNALIREIHLTGGVDPEDPGQRYKGCLDLDRGLWELPEGVPKSSLVVAVAIDVGQENRWGLYCSATSTEKDSEYDWILAAEGRRMPAGTAKGLLDYDFDRKCFVGLLEEWWQASVAMGLPITWVIPEINAAQRHLFRETNVFDRWCLSRKVRTYVHNTAKNKNDKKIGVEAMVPIRYQLGAYRIPWRPGPTQTAMRDLYNEAKGYGQSWPSDDIVLAQWMRTLNRSKVSRPVAVVQTRDDVPGWVKKLA